MGGEIANEEECWTYNVSVNTDIEYLKYFIMSTQEKIQMSCPCYREASKQDLALTFVVLQVAVWYALFALDQRVSAYKSPRDGGAY